VGVVERVGDTVGEVEVVTVTVGVTVGVGDRVLDTVCVTDTVGENVGVGEELGLAMAYRLLSADPNMTVP